ncbi:Integral membrane protein [Streptomyces albidoflavus]|nr:glycosyltransferase family 39 protein [Streptomyces albidoflavus]BDH54178.1 membrane protein [Streptomyces albus]AGI91390.1 Integral membrane protein [Streptomyces albidoflavus]EFE80436.1 integral membrane protein [Streptomyces albidoflavus]QLP95243.1 Integral membrane protein [Streptomyces albidoflavus]WAE13572.1 Integral membrane protein [Streptomyces albidoflavus]
MTASDQIRPLSAPRAPDPGPPGLRRAGLALAVCAAVRLTGLAVLTAWSTLAGNDAHRLLSRRWDSLWYARVAEQGYGWEVVLPDGTVHSNLAFFPLLPWLERLGSWLTPLAAPDVGLVVSALASLAAAWGIYAVAERLYGAVAGVTAVALWAVLPVGIVQSMAYSESLFTALAAWALYALLRERWVVAGLLASLAGLTRPVGMAVTAAVLLGVALAARRERRLTPAMAAGALLSPLGAGAYVLWVGARTGDPLFGYLSVQEGWGNGFDGGLAFARFIGSLLAGPGFWGGLGLVAGLALLAWLCARCVRQGQPAVLLVYAGIVVVLAVCASGYFGSKPRLLLPAFPLLLPLAVGLARWGAVRRGLLLAGVGLLSAGYAGFWLNGSGPP